MNQTLLNKEVQDFLEENYQEDISKIVFKGSPFPGISVQELAVQLKGKKKAQKKLPTWFHAREILYPPALNLEQTSSEKTADYKSSWIQGQSLLDLTGGFGVDAYFFSRTFKKITHCESNEELSEIAGHNFEVLGANNIQTYRGNGLVFLEQTSETFDWIYLDPSRRNDRGGRVFQLSDCLPNVPLHLDLLLKKGRNILIKTSPLLDLQAGIRELDAVQEIHVVAIENEVKELLWIMGKGSKANVKIRTINFRKKGDEIYKGSMEMAGGVQFSSPLTYLYEPNAAVMKSGLADLLATDLSLKKLHPNSQLFTSEKLIQFPGRRFEIKKVLPYKKKKLKTALNLEKAHITTRNFPASAPDLRKQLKLQDGGEFYVFFTTLLDEKKVVLVCKKA